MLTQILNNAFPPWLVVLPTAATIGVLWKKKPSVRISIAVMVLLSMAVAGTTAQQASTEPGGLMQAVARSCALLCFLWTLAAATASRRWNVQPQLPDRTLLLHMSNTIALLLGVVTFVLNGIFLCIRAIDVLLQLIYLETIFEIANFPLGISGIDGILLILSACVTSYWTSRNLKLIPCMFGCLFALAIWLCLLIPPVLSSPTHTPIRGDTTLWLQMVGAFAISLVTPWLVRWWWNHRNQERDLLQSSDGSTTACSGLTLCITTVALGVLLLTAFHLAMPIPFRLGGFRTTSLIIVFTSAVSGGSCMRLARVSGHRGPRETGMALISLSLCAAATLLIPNSPEDMQQRYPLIFTAIIIGLSLSTGLGIAWSKALAEKLPNTVNPSEVRSVERFVLVSGGLALIVGAVMSVWPRWPGIAISDASIGRMAGGLAADLLLLLILLRAARQFRRPVFQALSVLALVSAVGFVIARLAPFTPQFG